MRGIGQTPSPVRSQQTYRMDITGEPAVQPAAARRREEGMRTGPGASVSFEDFVRARSAALFRTALLLTGQDRAEAEDLLQGALERAYRHWGRVCR